MNPIVVAKPHTPEWHAARSTGIGASEIATAAGLNPFQTPLELYLRKRGEIGPVEDNDAMRLGRLLEPAVKAEYCYQTGATLLDPEPALYRHPEHEFILATPDGIVTEKLGLEAKTTSWRQKKEYGDEGTDDAPSHYLMQCQSQMAVMNFDEVDLAVLFDGAVLRCFKILRNEDLIRLMIGAASELWQRIKDGRPPDPNWEHPSTPKLIREMNSTIRDTRILFTQEENQSWAEYVRLGEVIKKAEQQRDQIKARLEYAIGEHFAGVFDDGRMLRRKEIAGSSGWVERKPRIDVRAVKYDGGAIVEREDSISGAIEQ